MPGPIAVVEDAVLASRRTIVKEVTMRKFLTSVPLVAILAAGATPGARPGVGAAGGAGVGAGVGALAGGWKGAVIGAAVGGLAGGAVGNYLDKQAEELKQVAENTKRTEDGILVDLKSKLLFNTDSAVLKPDAVEQIAKLGDILAKYPEDRIRIQGHTDSTGTVSHNEELSMRRGAPGPEGVASRRGQAVQEAAQGTGWDRPIP